MSTHPDPADRYNKVKEMAKEEQAANPDKQYKVNRDSYLKMIDGIIYGPDPRQGFEENGKFYHPELLFEFPIPNNWRVNNMPSQVQMSPEDGKAVLTMDLAAGADLQQPVLRMLTYFILYDGKIYKFNGLSKKEDFNQHFSTFQRSMKNFKKLTDQSKINKKPTTVAIKTVKKNSDLKAALASFGMKGTQLKELSILNGMELNDQVKAGSLIKTFGLLGGGVPEPTVPKAKTNSSSSNNTSGNTKTTTNVLPNNCHLLSVPFSRWVRFLLIDQ